MKKIITMLIGLIVMGNASAQSSSSIGNFTTNAVLQSTCISGDKR